MLGKTTNTHTHIQAMLSTCKGVAKTPALGFIITSDSRQGIFENIVWDGVDHKNEPVLMRRV